MRDRHDNVVVVCSIENLDPMGVHTGDSITVAPALTLTDREYQRMRDVGIDIIRAVGVDTGGCNIQFAINPDDGRLIVIEMNPRVSRSSALASKATGFPIAKIAARLAIGYTLDEIPNDITRETPASFEPTLDYIVVKVPRFAFEKFPHADADPHDDHEERRRGHGHRPQLPRGPAEGAAVPGEARRGVLVAGEPCRRRRRRAAGRHAGSARRPTVGGAAGAVGRRRHRRRARGEQHRPVVPRPDLPDQRACRRGACGGVPGPPHADAGQALRLLRPPARRAARASRGRGARAAPRARRAPGLQDRRHVRCGVRGTHAVPLLLVRRGDRGGAQRPRQGDHPGLGAEPHRPGHRVRLLVRARRAHPARRGLRDDHGQLQPRDRLDRLRHLRPAVLRAAHARGRARGRARRAAGGPPRRRHRPARRADPARPGAAAQGRRRADHRHEPRVDPPRGGARRVRPRPRRGRADRPEARHRPHLRGGAGHRRRRGLPGARAAELRARRPRHGDRLRRRDARRLPRPARRTSTPSTPCSSTASSTTPSRSTSTPSTTATELYLAGVMEHIEEAGIHSGDSACALPPITLGVEDIDRIRRSTLAIAEGVGVRGLLNVQYAMAGDVLYVLEANPRASRTVPFVSKATAVPVAKAAARVMVGQTIADLRAEGMLPAKGDGGTMPHGRRDLGQGGGAALRPLPRRRHRARSGDALDRRGHGHRRLVRHRLRQVAGGGVRRRTAHVGHRVRVPRQPRQARGDLPDQAARRPRVPHPGHGRHGGGAAAQRRARSRSCASSTRAAGPTASPRRSTRSWPATSSSS